MSNIKTGFKSGRLKRFMLKRSLNNELFFVTGKTGSVEISEFIFGEGTTNIVEMPHREVKKLRDWLTKVIDYVER